MARKKKHEEHENHERWLVSYADFITLLFAFFVVMYSVSSVNDGKFRVLSSSIVTAFNRPVKTLDPIQIGKASKAMPARVILRSTRPVMVEIPGIPGSRRDKKKRDGGKAGGGKAGEGNIDERKDIENEKIHRRKEDQHDLRKKRGLRSSGIVLRKIGEDLEKALSSLIDQGLVSINKESQRVEVQIKSNVLYQSGSATLSLDSIPVLEKIAKILTPFPNNVMVEGYTDNIPISNMIYPSNWELSAARSASVVHLFMKSGVAPERMTATGYAEFRPIADNNTQEGRSKNRRVVLVIPAEMEAKDIVEALKGSGVGVGGNTTEGEDGKQAEESLISNIILKRDSMPGMDLSPSEIIESVKIKGGDTDKNVSRETGVAMEEAVDTILDEKPGVFPVKLTPFQLPELPSLQNAADQSQVQSQTGQEKDKSDSDMSLSETSPRLKGKVKTLHKSDEKQIQVERKVKLKRTTEIGHEVDLQSITKSGTKTEAADQLEARSDGQEEVKGSGRSPTEAGRKGSFSIIRLPGVQGFNDSIDKGKDSSKSTQLNSGNRKQSSQAGSTTSSTTRSAAEKVTGTKTNRKVILKRIVEPSYESTPQDVPAPGSEQEPQQSGANDQVNDGGKLDNQQSEQNSSQEFQRPRFIAPPIQFPLGNTESGTDTSETNNTDNNN